MKVKKLTALLLAALLVALSGCQVMTDEELYDYFVETRQDGYQLGYEDATKELEAEADEQYQKGYDSGYNVGYADGYAHGKSVGKSSGAQSGGGGTTTQSSGGGGGGGGAATQTGNQGTTVYVTNSGSKYHNAGCRYLWNSSIAISLSDAKASGYTACSVCNPPA